MFATHNPVIRDYVANGGPDALEHVFQFVVATVQQSLENTPAIVLSYQREGSESRDAWGWKGGALDWIAKHKDGMWDEIMHAYETSFNPHYRLLMDFAAWPGLGLVKGGFMAQLCFGVGGCIDTHNLRRFNIEASRFKASRFKDAKTYETRSRIVWDYVDVIEKQGGCEALWNGWCDHVAALRPDVFEDGFAVSEMHLTALGLSEGQNEIPF